MTQHYNILLSSWSNRSLYDGPRKGTAWKLLHNFFHYVIAPLDGTCKSQSEWWLKCNASTELTVTMLTVVSSPKKQDCNWTSWLLFYATSFFWFANLNIVYMDNFRQPDKCDNRLDLSQSTKQFDSCADPWDNFIFHNVFLFFFLLCKVVHVILWCMNTLCCPFHAQVTQLLELEWNAIILVWLCQNSKMASMWTLVCNMFTYPSWLLMTFCMKDYTLSLWNECLDINRSYKRS